MMTARPKNCDENTPFWQVSRPNNDDILNLPGGLGETDTFCTNNLTQRGMSNEEREQEKTAYQE